MIKSSNGIRRNLAVSKTWGTETKAWEDAKGWLYRHTWIWMSSDMEEILNVLLAHENCCVLTYILVSHVSVNGLLNKLSENGTFRRTEGVVSFPCIAEVPNYPRVASAWHEWITGTGWPPGFGVPDGTYSVIVKHKYNLARKSKEKGFLFTVSLDLQQWVVGMNHIVAKWSTRLHLHPFLQKISLGRPEGIPSLVTRPLYQA